MEAEAQAGVKEDSIQNSPRKMAPPPTSAEATHTKNFVEAIVEKLRRIPDRDEREQIRKEAHSYYWKMSKIC